jgi:hypothetical protein
MTKTLLLHLGGPKTGTTSLQHTLLENRRALLQRGVQYPNIEKRERQKGFRIAMSEEFAPVAAPARSLGIGTERDWRRFRAAYAEELVRRARDPGFHMMILSDEDLFGQTDTAVVRNAAAFARAHFARVSAPLCGLPALQLLPAPENRWDRDAVRVPARRVDRAGLRGAARAVA